MSDTLRVVTVYEEQQRAHSEVAMSGAQALVVETQTAADEAGIWLRALAARRAAIEEFFEPLCRAAHEAHRLLTQRRSQACAWMDEPAAIVRLKLAAWLARGREQALAEQATAMVVVEAPRVEGVSRAETVKVECHDLAALVRAVADGKAPLDCLQVNQLALDRMGRGLREVFAVPGCRVVVEGGIRVRR